MNDTIPRPHLFMQSEESRAISNYFHDKLRGSGSCISAPREQQPEQQRNIIAPPVANQPQTQEHIDYERLEYIARISSVTHDLVWDQAWRFFSAELPADLSQAIDELDNRFGVTSANTALEYEFSRFLRAFRNPLTRQRALDDRQEHMANLRTDITRIATRLGRQHNVVVGRPTAQAQFVQGIMPQVRNTGDIVVGNTVEGRRAEAIQIWNTFYNTSRFYQTASNPRVSRIGAQLEHFVEGVRNDWINTYSNSPDMDVADLATFLNSRTQVLEHFINNFLIPARDAPHG